MLPRKCSLIVVALLFISKISCFLGDDDEEEPATMELEQEPNFEETSVEKVGAYVTQITKKPYAVSLMINSSYICSAVILNPYWLLTVANCFDTHMIKSYVIEGKTDHFSARVGSNYNHKGGILHEIKSMLNNFDYRVTALKLKKQLEFGPKVQAVAFPEVDSEPSLGYMATMIAWTPSGHIRAVNAPLIETTICDPYTNLLAGQYVCLGGVQDPNKQFCRRDNGGAVIQNKTLIAITTFSHTCAVYMKIHAFPKISKLIRWLDTIIWDEIKRPVTKPPPTTKAPPPKKRKTPARRSHEGSYQRIDIDELNKIPSGNQARTKNPYALPYKQLLHLPLEPSANNGAPLPQMSLYESYLENKRSSNYLEDMVPLYPVNNDIAIERPRPVLPINYAINGINRINGTPSPPMVIFLLPYQSAGQLTKFNTFVPRKDTKKKENSDQKKPQISDYDYDDRKYARTVATTPVQPHTMKWNMRGVTNKDSNQESKNRKNYDNSFKPMDAKELRKIVDYDTY